MIGAPLILRPKALSSLEEELCSYEEEGEVEGGGEGGVLDRKGDVKQEGEREIEGEVEGEEEEGEEGQVGLEKEEEKEKGNFLSPSSPSSPSPLHSLSDDTESHTETTLLTSSVLGNGKSRDVELGYLKKKKDKEEKEKKEEKKSITLPPQPQHNNTNNTTTTPTKRQKVKAVCVRLFRSPILRALIRDPNLWAAIFGKNLHILPFSTLPQPSQPPTST